MTLYNYVKDRGQLEELVAEAVIAGVELPDAVPGLGRRTCGQSLWRCGRLCVVTPTSCRWC